MKTKQIGLALSDEAFKALNDAFTAKNFTAAGAIRAGLELLAKREGFKMPELHTRAYQRGAKQRQAKVHLDIDLDQLFELRAHSKKTGESIASIVRKSLSSELPGKKVA